MHKEGTIKFQCNWIEEKLPETASLKTLTYWRNLLCKHRLIGADLNGIGYGNVSMRLHGLNFLISGTSTGHLPTLTQLHYAIVTSFDIEHNTLNCRGPVKASSESLSHAALYVSDQQINAVIHVHSQALWDKLKGNVPSTSPAAAYGTPKLALEIMQLSRKSHFKHQKIIVMEGHESGILTFGPDLEEAGNILLSHL